jgi:hypothetical protein
LSRPTPAIRYAEILSAAGVQHLGDVKVLLANPDVLAKIESALRTVPGHGSGARLSYLWMLTGDDSTSSPTAWCCDG